MAHRFDHGSDPVVQVISGPDPDTYDAAWRQWLEALDADEPTTPDLPAATELAAARDAGEV